MARKNYQVIAKDGAAWQRIHNQLTSITHNTTNVPDRSCLCKNEIRHSETRGTYQLSVAEVEELRKNSDVAAVFVDPNYHPDTDKYDCTPCSLRFGKNVKNYRTLFSVANNEYTEVASSLMSITGQLNQGTTNWVLVKNAHSGTAAMNYWQSMGFPLIYDYGVYPSAPTNASDPDSLRSTTQTGANLIDISNTGYYELEVACDGEYAAVWTTGASTYPKVPLVTTDDLTINTDDLASTFPDNIWGKDRKDPRNQGIGYRIIQLGKLNPGTITLNFEVRNGSVSSGAETWDRNPGCIAWKLRFLGNMNIRELGGGGNAGNSTFVTHIPQDNPTSADHNRTGYQILRCAEGTSNNPWSDTTTQINQDITYTNDGTDVDCIVLDNGVWTGHPEFVTDDEDPQHYISGNVLSAHGRSGVLDILLDAPYYLDPDFFNSNPSFLLTTRWDGTRVPTDTAAKNWWNSATDSQGVATRSSSFPDFGSIQIGGGYTRARHCGTDSLPPTNRDGGRNGGGHGTPCASLMYGKNYGWAFNSNKWTLSYPLGQLDAPAADACLDAIKVFHQYKPTNPKHGTKDPTVTNCSFSTGGTFGSITFDKTNYGKYQFQVSGNSWDAANDVVYDQAKHYDTSLPFRAWGSQPDFMRPRVMKAGAGSFPKWINPGTTDATFPEFYAMREAANAGVVFVAAAGNDGMYRSTDNDINFWNARTWNATVQDCNTEWENCGYTNRGSWPGSHNYRLNITNPSGYATDNFEDIFVIGAMDDQLLGDMRKTTSSDALLKDTGTRNPYADSCEITANNLGNNCDVLSPFGSDFGQHGDDRSYSNVGPLIDFYAPADSTLAASTVDDGNALPYTRGTAPVPQHPSTRTHAGGGSYKYRDGYFNGTSAAAPVAAGLLACILQQNRGWSPNVLKTNVKLGISNATNWYKGFAPNGAYDPKWLSQYDTKGEDVKIIKEWSNTKTTPNSSYETTSGISPSRPNLNERFSITGSGSHDVKIIAIKEFATSDAGSPTELRIANGWYPVQIKKDTTSSSDLANYRMRVSANSDQTLEVSSNGGSSYTALTITVVNGNFDTDDSGRFWYYLSVDDSVGLPAVNNPTYNIQTNTSSINEGATLITTVTTTNVSNGTTLYWSFSGTNINSSDFSSGSLTGSGSISNDSFNFTHVVANDTTTEGTETIQIKVFTDAARQIQVATKNVIIADTSVSAAYAISPSTTSVNEGSPLNYGVGTSNVADGTTLYWSFGGTNVDADDFSPSGLTGSGTISNNAFAVSKTVVNDLKTEGVETVVFKLFTDSARTNEVASNSSVKIQDTSTTPVEPGYTITPNKTTLDEGDQIIFTVATTNVAENTTLHWQVLADTGNVDTNDFGSGEFAGSDQISSGGFTITQNVANDATTEGEEKYTIVLYPDNTYDWPSRLAQSAVVTINDTSVSASTYVISPSPAQIDEGASFTTTINTTYVDEGTVLYWRMEGAGIDANDFSSGSLTGSGTVDALGTFNFSHTAANDTTTESQEEIRICLYGDSARTIKLAETGVLINDTSQSPTPTYVIQPDKTEYVENEVVSVRFITSGVAAGTTLHWKMVPTGANPIAAESGGTTGSTNSVDFDAGPGMWGSANVQTPAPGVTNDGFGESWITNADQLTEGDETFKIEVYSGHSGGAGGTWTGLLATSPVCTIKDTSIAPGASTYNLTANTNPINEGDYLGLTVTTTNVANGTVLYWEYSGVTSGDLEDGALQGSVTIPPEATKSWGTTIKADTLTEGSETLAVKLYTDSARTTQVGSTLNITINDTSIGLEPTYTLSTTDTRFNEGDSFTTTVTTTNVADNTVLYWALSGTGISEDDFNLANTVTGSGTVTSNTFTFSHTIKEDVTTEGDEVISIKLYSDSGRTTQVGNTLSVTIRDTSQPGYNIRVTAPNNNEYIITGTDRNGSI